MIGGHCSKTNGLIPVTLNEKNVSNLSRSMTLLSGTVILTGTPDGVGFTRQPPLFLQAGDLVSIEIEKIGTLTNEVVSEDSNINMEDFFS